MQNLIRDLSNLTFFQMLVFGSVLSGGFYFSFYNNGESLKRETEKIRSNNADADSRLSEKQEELERIIQFEKDLKSDEESIQFFLKYIPQEMSPVDIFQFITREAKRAGVNINRKQDLGSSEDNMLHSLKVSLNVSGSFPQIVYFLSRLTAQKRILIVDDIQISTASQNVNVSEASMHIYGFRYKKTRKKEGGAK